MPTTSLTAEEKIEKRKQQKLDWYYRNREKVNEKRRSGTTNLNTDTKKNETESVKPSEIKSVALNQNKYIQHTQNFRKYDYTEWEENEGFRPSAEYFQPKSGIYRVKYEVSQQLPSQKDLNAVSIHEPIADKIYKPTGLRTTIKGSGMPWSQEHSFAHDYVWRNK